MDISNNINNEPALEDIILKNKLNGEFFKMSTDLEGLVFEDIIYVSNFGEIYNKTQNKLYDYENSTVNLKILNDTFKGISRWNLTSSIFGISNNEYETRRRLKKQSYGYHIQTDKKTTFPKNNKKHAHLFLAGNNEIEINGTKNENFMDLDLNKLEFELVKYKYIYDEVVKQKKSLETTITKLEARILKFKSDKNDMKYNNTVIYMIRPKHNNFYMYVGHTIDKERRLNEHIRSTVADNKKLYRTIRDTGGWDHWEMIVLSTNVCRCREEALKIEQDWCEKLRPNLNSVSPFA